MIKTGDFIIYYKGEKENLYFFSFQKYLCRFEISRVSGADALPLGRS